MLRGACGAPGRMPCGGIRQRVAHGPCAPTLTLRRSGPEARPRAASNPARFGLRPMDGPRVPRPHARMPGGLAQRRCRPAQSLTRAPAPRSRIPPTRAKGVAGQRRCGSPAQVTSPAVPAKILGNARIPPPGAGATPGDRGALRLPKCSGGAVRATRAQRASRRRERSDRVDQDWCPQPHSAFPGLQERERPKGATHVGPYSSALVLRDCEQPARRSSRSACVRIVLPRFSNSPCPAGGERSDPAAPRSRATDTGLRLPMSHRRGAKRSRRP